MAQPRSPLRLPVRTKSGQKLGHVVDLTIDPDTHLVMSYHVKPSRLVPDMVQSPLLIHRSQVIEITDSEMIVDDTVDRQVAGQPLPLASA